MTPPALQQISLQQTSLRLRLKGPLQSWGVASLFDTRTTAPEPSRSAVIGLMAGALGRDRRDDVKDLSALHFGVRVDLPGTYLRDYQTSQPQEGTKAGQAVRYYLQDAAFWVAVEGDADLLGDVSRALADPHYPTVLGRRNCSPSVPILPPTDGGAPLTGVPLLEALLTAPSLRPVRSRDTLESWQARNAAVDYRLTLDRRLVPVKERPHWLPGRQQDVPVAPFSERQFRMRDTLSRDVPLELLPDPDLQRFTLMVTEPSEETV